MKTTAIHRPQRTAPLVRHRLLFVLTPLILISSWVVYGLVFGHDNWSAAQTKPTAAATLVPGLGEVSTGDAVSLAVGEPIGIRTAQEPFLPKSPVKETSQDAASSPQRAWDLVRELEILALSPADYHAQALPIAKELGSLCGGSAKDTSQNTGESTDGGGLVEDLLGQVVDNAEEPSLVRGAVLLGIAPSMDVDAFHRVFDGWFDSGNTPLELLRAATLAAARRGAHSPCDTPVLLGQLNRIETVVPVEMPGIYPLRLDRLIDPYEAGVLRAWFGANDDRSNELHTGTLPPQDPEAQRQIADTYITSELLYIVWGHRALVEPDIERALIEAVSLSEDESEERNLINLRAATFLVKALSFCNDTLMSVAKEMASSPNPLVQGVATSMDDVGVWGVGSSLIEKLEGLRYSGEDSSKMKFTMALLDAEKSLEQMKDADPAELEIATEYLDGIVRDESLGEFDRSLSFGAITAGASWPNVIKSARTVLSSNSPQMLQAVVLTSLRQSSGSNDRRRKEALALLRSALGTESRPSFKRELEATISELSGR